MAATKRPRFIALPVGQGDAFFFERRNVAVLVDGGRSPTAFADLFRRQTKRESVDVLVCTHNDADHAAGLIGFFRGGLRATEVWLPGSWTQRLSDLLLRPGEFFDELVGNIARSEKEANNLEDFADRENQNLRESKAEEESRSTDAIGQAIETAAEAEPFHFAPHWPYPYPFPFWDWPPWIERFWKIMHDPTRMQILFEAIEAAGRIREIAVLAHHAGARIRWFHFGVNCRGCDGKGFLRFLVPMNAREILEVPRIHADIPPLDFLKLTVTNKESLVFQAPGEADHPGVLFTGDSDLGSVQKVPWERGMIITAPHHGSEANGAIYERFQKETDGDCESIWVRSDGRFRSRPCEKFRGLYLRFCTLCRGRNDPKQAVHLEVAKGWWGPVRWRPVQTRECRCAPGGRP
jgi:hypothetical protein